jgi:hypothetical protein
MTQVFGQHINRAERVEQYARWAGAQPVVNGVAVKTAEQAAEEPNEALATQEVTTIRHALQNGVARVVCDLQHAPTVQRMRDLLTADELARVSFAVEGAPVV